MARNVVEGIFYFIFLHENLILHFMSENNGFFVKQILKFVLIFVPTQYPKY
jgi:hypothetical protein